MPRLLPLVVGLAVLVGSGVVHGLWTDRWQPSRELAEAVERLRSLPDDVGSWKGEETEQDAATLAFTGAVGHWSRTFTDPASGEKVLVILLCGKAARMAVHRPEHCYRTAGYEMTQPALRVRLRSEEQGSAFFWTGVFARDEEQGPEQLRIFWAWAGCSAPGSAENGRWEAPDNPRLAFARQRALFKLYVIRSVTGSGSTGVGEREPCVKLLEQLLPILDTLSSPS